MMYLAHTAHAQFCALWMSSVGWTLTAVAMGLIQWRIWRVSDMEIITSGEAWVGIWRVCFNSHTDVTPSFQIMHCRDISLTETFTPPEIGAGQVLLLLSLLTGLCGNAGGVYAMRNVYFGIKDSPVRLVFFITGVLCLLAAAMSLIPLVWNINSVVTNQTIKFPPEFQMPSAPTSQTVGCGIGVGMVGSVLMIFSGIVFCTYRLPVRSQLRTQPALSQAVHLDCTVPARPALTIMRGTDNPAFESHEHL
ncbi:claudin-34-like [Xyrichtys novacula]|uniref:Claudin-34-like n=1 Tax=Xyrichtys novacula TaxID=13765 RepID=A0AAV1HQ07_XYRNO|nr:claudin-34-like [Xyrichtys novacula]